MNSAASVTSESGNLMGAIGGYSELLIYERARWGGRLNLPRCKRNCHSCLMSTGEGKWDEDQQKVHDMSWRVQNYAKNTATIKLPDSDVTDAAEVWEVLPDSDVTDAAEVWEVLGRRDRPLVIKQIVT
ncbi:hypothetical protein R3P38DRAFT_2789386 [Favolaschia claudopus]|uniref:Uncharacterized protein n=1 Tax=Favolaschia claudopus TaxID=2862362 RepID=A0AAW0AJJ8_9AGAR